MNKQEAIKLVKNTSYSVPINDSVKYLREETVIKIIDELDEPEKPVVPKYVADMIVERKKQNQGIVTTIKNLSVFEKSLKWVIENEEDFVKAWLYGYEVEHEQQYVVAIPDDGRNGFIQLWKNREGNLLFNFEDKIKYGKVHLLTEQEIKQKDERLWKFAEEVGDD